MKILIADGIDNKAVDLLKKNNDVLVQHFEKDKLLTEINEFDAVIVRSATKITQEVIEKGEKLKVIGRAGIGVDNIDVKFATIKKIPVVNAPLGSTVSVAELAIAQMLALSRLLLIADEGTRQGKWPKKQIKGTELFEKTLGLIGCGRIGAEVTKRAKAFGMEVIAYDPYISNEIADKIGFKLVKLDELLKNADYISIHALLTDETRGMVSTNEFEMMKNSAYIVNCARGGIIDEDALFEALSSKKITGAALDVFENEPIKESKLFALKNIIFSPHVGASTKEAQIRAGVTVAEQVLEVLNNNKPQYCVNKVIYE